MDKVKLRSPIRWFGGKGLKTKKLLSFIPHLETYKIYAEVFGGGASLLFAKEPSGVEIYNDIDKGLVNFFRVLRSPEKFYQFYHLAVLTPYSRQEHKDCCATWQECKDEVESAYRWFVCARMSFAGRFDSGWGFNINEINRNMSSVCSRWLSILELLPLIHKRLMRVQIENKDFRTFIPTYDTEKTFFYCDPPYIPETRKSGKYIYEMTAEDHKELVEILLKVKGKVMLSGYNHKIYQPLENAGWQRIDYKTPCSATPRTKNSGNRGKNSILGKPAHMRTESVWVNYKLPTDTLDKSLIQQKQQEFQEFHSQAHIIS